MHDPTIIERAFQLAPASTSVDDIRKTLRQEGYSNVDAHLAGSLDQSRAQAEICAVGARPVGRAE